MSSATISAAHQKHPFSLVGFTSGPSGMREALRNYRSISGLTPMAPWPDGRGVTVTPGSGDRGSVTDTPPSETETGRAESDCFFAGKRLTYPTKQRILTRKMKSHMGDKSPKSAKKHASQKQAKANSATEEAAGPGGKAVAMGKRSKQRDVPHPLPADGAHDAQAAAQCISVIIPSLIVSTAISGSLR